MTSPTTTPTTTPETTNPPPAVSASSEAAVSGWSRQLVWAVGGYLVFRWLLTLVQLPNAAPPLLVLAIFGLVALGSIGLPIIALAVGAGARPTPRQSLFAGLGGLLLLALAVLTAHYIPPPLRPLAAGLVDVGKIAAAGGFGLALGTLIREPNILAPASVFAAFADFVVVHFGTVHHALQSEKGAQVVAAVSAQVPTVHRGLPPLTIGPADFLFLGFFLACATRFEMGTRRNAIVFTLILALSLVLVPLVGPIPALAPMTLAFLTTNWKKFRLTRQETISTLVVLVLAGALFLGYFLFFFPALVPAAKGS